MTATTLDNAVNLDQAAAQLEATSVRTAMFVNYLQAERTAAVVYLSAPTAANLTSYKRATAATDAARPAFEAAVASPATRSAETTTEVAKVATINSDLGLLPELRQGVEARALTPVQAFGSYTQGIAVEPKLFLDEVSSLNNPVACFQGVGLVDAVQAREDLEEEDALLSGILAGASDGSPQQATSAGRAALTQERIAFTQLAGDRQSALLDSTAILSPANLAVYNDQVNARAPVGLQNELTTIEGAIAADTGDSTVPLTPTGWRQIASTLEQAYFNGGVATVEAQLSNDRQTAHAAQVRVAEASVGALLGLLLTILVTSLVGRDIIRRLAGLRRSALALAEQQLPAVVSKLRQGESVDVAAEAPPIHASGDEIGQVGQAFDSVRQTAIRAAVDESRLRKSINDVFRNLARRNQSLLHRQLTMLDDMERRVTDPAALDDLFRLDHLTTRMRRHAEGLIILSGASAGRSWSSPVRLIDVMRSAAAEVEDYARVSVASKSNAALSPSAVTSVIHLLAELIENATTLSPPETEVRVQGGIVGNGFAIEIEDRGLGITAQRLAELNERLASLVDFNSANSEQLGLFVVAQLARRHGITASLRPSPYGGITAIVLIPAHLVVPGNQVPSTPVALTNGQAFGPTGSGAISGSGQSSNGQSGSGQSAEMPGEGTFARVRISGAIRHPPSNPLGNGGGKRPAPAPGMTGSPPPQAPRVPGGTEMAGFDAFRPLPHVGDRISDEQPWQPTANLAPANGDGAGGGSPAPQDPASGYYKGLPRRARQASIVPQLRDRPGPTDAPQTRRDTPSDIGSRMSAMQRGWQQGRSQSAPNVPGPPWERRRPRDNGDRPGGPTMAGGIDGA